MRAHLLAAMLGLAIRPAVAVEVKPSLFDNVVHVLRKSFYDEDFRRHQLPDLVRHYRPKALAARSLQEQREVTHELLSRIPATHLALISDDAYEYFSDALHNQPAAMFGFELLEHAGDQFAYNVLEGGPADAAGLRRWDRVLSIDGVRAGDSARLDWRTDDAFHPDPPIRSVLGKRGEQIHLVIERAPGDQRPIDVESATYSAFEAAKASARVFTLDGQRIGYLHLWMVPHGDADDLLRNVLEGPCAECAGFVLDLRGRGGSASMVRRLLRVIDGRDSKWSKPIVALIDNHTRSAKEILAYEIRERGLGVLVGEHTAGAVIPATFVDVGHQTYLMLPVATLREYTKLLELKGVAPDIQVEDSGPYSGGRDPILLRGLQTADVVSEVVVSGD